MRRPNILPASWPDSKSSRLLPLKPPANNPGNLAGYYHLPEGLKAPAPLVVVLHGCGQDAAGYDRGSGWSRLAERHGFALLFPEQQRANNPLNCFNWFGANDSQRGMGEPASIKAMIDVMVKDHQVDRTRIFITGLSAGGAMASVMLATYPETFAGGAIIAGIAFGCASDMSQAFNCMGGRAHEDALSLAAKVRRASPHKGPWPRISVWQGTADDTVEPSNADAIVLQWAQVHGIAAAPSRVDNVDGYPHRVWLGPAGKPVIEQYLITGMQHGTPLNPGTGEGELGEAGAHMLDANISSTERIAAFWEIAPEVRETGRQRTATAPKRQGHKRLPAATSSVQQTIEDALRAAGLLGKH